MPSSQAELTIAIVYCNQHMCARLIFNESKYCHITSLLMELHWLPIKLRIEF